MPAPKPESESDTESAPLGVKEWEAEPTGAGWRRREWLTKREAARFLGVSERQIERHSARGRLRFQRQRREAHQSTARVLFMREDLEAIRRDEPNYYPELEKEPNGAAATVAVAPESKSILPAVAPGAGGMVLDRLLELLGSVPPPPPRPWLTLDEAAAFSGLPRPFLKQMAVAGRLDAVNVGSEARPRWRIRRAALERPIGGGD